MRSPLIWLSGAQPEILASCKTDRAKYVGVGSAVLVTSAMAAASMSFALHIALKATLPVAIPFAIAWGLAIMSLDRWLVVSMTRNQLLLAIPRVLLGLLFGAIISTPLTLQIFHVEIDNQISVDHTNAANAYSAALARSPLQSKVAQDQKAVAADQAVIDSGGGTGLTPAQDPTLISLNKQLASDQASYQKYYNAWHCEEYGFPGHCVVGNGPAAATDKSAFQMYQRKIQTDQSQISAEEAALKANNSKDAAQSVATARGNLAADQAKLSLDQGNLNRLKQSFNTTNANDTGILASLKALDELRTSSPTIFTAELLLWLFFTSIECLPVGVKVLLNLGPENTYEKALAKAELHSLRRAEDEMLRQHRAAVRDREAMSQESERLHYEWREKVLPDLIQDELLARERVVRARMATWEQHARADAARHDRYGDEFRPGGFTGRGGPGIDWTRAGRKPRRGHVRPRLAAAWQAFRSTSPVPRSTGPIPVVPGSYWPNA